MIKKHSIHKQSSAYIAFRAINIVIMLTIILLIMIPILKIIIDSFDEKASETVFRIFPETFTLGAYKLIVSRPSIFRPLMISFITTISGTILAMSVTSLYAYGLSQRSLPGRKFLLVLALITMVFRAGMIPLFLVIRDLGLMNSLLAVILVHAMDAYYLLLLKNFFEGIPTSIFDAAEIDGCSPLQTFIRVVLPLSKPGLAAIGLFYTVFYWNQFFDYILYIQTKPNLHNFQVFLRSLVIETDTQGFEGFSFATQSLKNAAITVSIIPVLVLYPFVQKYFVKGINLGAVKG
ncbi:carbohydrate ABC transporter permease [Oceanispirochaeta sp.]|jgi:putative aldouronate transport system permease protein|uniref:carbohydrate ABC transporter permease n=1 Tax=Oceanispirochaeta sp. TaxID=2035350 RepID=UPI0026079686|nr:carbohydrate ABC transporter permease [Oceanispirochaeta sp.]MDA3955509.1 carbohydrate ABC transporter permease [Oceanispirochaeta sp.]